MSVTRYFNQPAPAVPTHVAAQEQLRTSALSLNDPLNQSSGDQSGDNFHPFNPRFEVSSVSELFKVQGGRKAFFKYFNQPAPAVPAHLAAQVPSALSLNDPLNQSSGDNFHPFNPRFEVSSDYGNTGCGVFKQGVQN